MSGSPEWMDYLRVVLGLVFVSGLIFFSAFFVKRTGLDKRITGNKGAGRLHIVETMYLDPRRRIVIVGEGDREHVLLLSAGGDLVIESRAKEGTNAA